MLQGKAPIGLGRGESQSLLVGTWVAAGLLLFLSISGLVAPEWTYPGPHLAEAFRPNDVVNLILVVPVLALALNRRDRLSGRLLWIATLLYFVYNSLVPLLALPTGIPEAGHLIVVAMSGGMAARLLRTLDHSSLRQYLSGQVAEPWSGGVLALFGAIVTIRAAVILITNGGMTSTEFGLLITDLVFGLGWFIAGLSLLFRRPSGYALGGASLFQSALLLFALSLVILVKPSVDGTPLAVLDLISTLVFAIVLAIPLVLFLTGLAQAQRRLRDL